MRTASKRTKRLPALLSRDVCVRACHPQLQYIDSSAGATAPVSVTKTAGALPTVRDRLKSAFSPSHTEARLAPVVVSQPKPEGRTYS
jgi:hypothetical protein